MAAFERTGPLQARATARWLRRVRASTVAWPPASWPSTMPATAWSVPRPRPSASAWATTVTPNPVKWKTAIERSPTASRHSACSHRGRASSGARATTSSGACSTTSVAGSSPPYYGTVADEKRSLWASRSYRGNHAGLPPRGDVHRRGPQGAGVRPPRRRTLPGCPNGRRPWPFWLVRAATGNVRDAKDRRLYPATDRCRSRHRQGPAHRRARGRCRPRRP